MKKRLIILNLILVFVNFTITSQIYGKKQLIPANNWVYDAVYTLSMESKQFTIADTAPLSVEEITLYLNSLDYESLSEGGKALFDKVMNYFNTSPKTFALGAVNLGVNFNANPEVMYKSNKTVDWSFATDYTGHIFQNLPDTMEKDGVTYKLNKEMIKKGYGAGSGFLDEQMVTPIAVFPFYLDFADVAFFEGQFFHGNNFWTLQEYNNYTNALLKGNDQDTQWPNYAYGNIGHVFNNGLGMSLSVAKEGLQWGRTQTGSVVYNNTFETDAYLRFNIYSKKIKYDAEVVEITNKRFLYVHSFTVIPFKQIKVALLEATMVNGPFEVRYLNPMMNFHNFSSWNQYMTAEEEKVYGTAHASSYMGFAIDYIPFKNARFYFNGCMNELQLSGELESVHGRTVPDGWGFQGGFEYNWCENKGGMYYSGIEAVYTTPFLYYKSGADWSLYRERYNIQKTSATPICSWIGTPFGPDATALQLRFGYRLPEKYNWEFKYLFVAHGENSFGLFRQKYVADDGTVWDAYYPATLYELGLMTNDDAYKLARSWKHAGTIQYTNVLSGSGSYVFNKYFSVAGSLSYDFIFNNKNQKNNFAHSIEMSLMGKFKIF